MLDVRCEMEDGRWKMLDGRLELGHTDITDHTDHTDLKEKRENPFLLLMGCTHTFSIHALSNPSTLSFDNAQIENSLATSTP